MIVLNMSVRLRLPELMKAKGYASAYQLVQAINGRVGEATIYRLVRKAGEIESVRVNTLEVLAAVFECDVADLFERKRGRTR